MREITNRSGIWCLLAWLLLAATPALAEETSNRTSNGQILFNKLPDGRDSLLNKVEFLEAPQEKWEWQEQMLFIYNDSILALHPEEAIIVRRNNKNYVSSKVLLPDGSMKQLFVERTSYGTKGRPSIFKFYQPEKAPQYYSHDKDSILVAISFKQKAGEPEDAFRQHLLADNQKAGGSPEIAEYIRQKTVPTRWSIREAYELIESQNPNKMPRFRFGGGFGLCYNETEAMADTQLNDETVYIVFDPEKQWQVTPMLFIDYQSIKGLNLRAELTFQKISLHRTFALEGGNPIEIAYNRTSLNIPLLARYTPVQLHGKLLPFIEGGFQMNIPLKSKYERRNIQTDEMGYVCGSETIIDKNAFFLLQFPVGIGLEYRFSQRHSLYWGARFIAKGEYYNRSVGTFKNGQTWATFLYYSL